jgi:hypothetical protein
MVVEAAAADRIKMLEERKGGNNKNTLCSYNISTLPLNKKGILKQHHARERGQHYQQHQVGG